MVDKRVGEVVAGRYEIVREISRGGMGAIYEVRHVRLNRSFAMKVLACDLNPAAMVRFEREAVLIAKLRHRNVVEVVDVELLEDGSPCMVMELLRGEDLAARIAKVGPLPWDAILHLADQVLSALVTTHEQGIVHRDLKPQNIFLARDDSGAETCKLLDFGISKLSGETTTVTSDDNVLGTPAYMSPEQADGRLSEVGPSTDVWALGAILFEMATAERAFAMESSPRTMYRICYGEPTAIETLRADTPPAFTNLLSRVLSRDPARRVTSGAELRRELHIALSEEGRRGAGIVTEAVDDDSNTKVVTGRG